MNIGGGGEPGEEDSILHEEAGPVVALPSQPKNQVKRALYVCTYFVHRFAAQHSKFPTQVNHLYIV